MKKLEPNNSALYFAWCESTAIIMWYGGKNALTDQLIDTLINWLFRRLTHSLTDSLTDSVSDWLTDSITHWQTHWLIQSPIDRLTNARTSPSSEGLIPYEESLCCTVRTFTNNLTLRISHYSPSFRELFIVCLRGTGVILTLRRILVIRSQ